MERDAASSRMPQPFLPFVKRNPGLPEDAIFYQVPDASRKIQSQGTTAERPHEEGQPIAGSGILASTRQTPSLPRYTRGDQQVHASDGDRKPSSHQVLK